MAIQNNGGEFQEYQSAQNQLLNIQAQQRQNLNEQRVMASADANTNAVISQAAGLMADNISTTQAANFDPQTQAILNQYGLGQPRIQKTRSTQSTQQQLSKQNIVINNTYKTENTTTNNVSVPSGGPVQGRPVVVGDGGIGKFKTWLNNTFAQQNEMAAKRERDYDIKQENLTKDSNKILRKLEGVGTKIGQALDPRRIANAQISPMKMLLTTIGIGVIAANFKYIVNFADKAQDFFKEGGTLVKGLGGKQNETVGQAFKNLLIGDDGIWGLIKNYINEGIQIRKGAIRQIPKPKLFAENFTDERKDPIGAIRSLNKSLRSSLSYGTKVLKAIIDPDSISENKEEVQKAAEKDIKKQTSSDLRDYREKNKSVEETQKVEIIDKNGNKYRGTDLAKGIYGDWKLSKDEHISGVTASTIEPLTTEVKAGDRNILLTNEHGNPIFEGIPEYSINDNGNVIKTVGAQVAVGQELVRLLNRAKNNKATINSAAVVQQLSSLAKVLNKNGEIIVSDYFKNFFEKVFNITDFTENYDKNNLLYAIDPKTNTILLIDKSQRNLFDNILSASPTNEGQNLYKVTSDGFSKIIAALTGETERFGLDDIKNTNYTFQQKVNNKLLGSGYNIYAHYVLPETENISAYNNILSYEYSKEDAINEYNKKKEDLKRLQDFGFSKENSSTPNTTTTATPITSSSTALSSTVQEKIQKAINFFTNDSELDLDETHAKAIVANLLSESSTLNPQEDNGKGNKGIAQWNKDRETNLLEWFNKTYPGRNITDIKNLTFEEQLECIKHELLSTPKFLNAFRTDSLIDADGNKITDPTIGFMMGFELGRTSTNKVSGKSYLDDPKIMKANWGLDYAQHVEKRTGKFNLINDYTAQLESTPTAFQQTVASNNIKTESPNSNNNTTNTNNVDGTIVASTAMITGELGTRLDTITGLCQTIAQNSMYKPTEKHTAQSYTA